MAPIFHHKRQNHGLGSICAFPCIIYYIIIIYLNAVIKKPISQESWRRDNGDEPTRGTRRRNTLTIVSDRFVVQVLQ